MVIQEIQTEMESIFRQFPHIESLKFNDDGKWVLQLTFSEPSFSFDSLFAVILYLENLPT